MVSTNPINISSPLQHSTNQFPTSPLHQSPSTSSPRPQPTSLPLSPSISHLSPNASHLPTSDSSVYPATTIANSHSSSPSPPPLQTINPANTYPMQTRLKTDIPLPKLHPSIFLAQTEPHG